MTPFQEHIAGLIIRGLRGELSAEEQAELDAWAGETGPRRELLESFADADLVGQGLRDYWIRGRIWQRLEGAMEREEDMTVVHKRAWIWVRGRRWVGAAAVLFLLMGGVWLWRRHLSGERLAPAGVPSVVVQDVAAPVLTKATVTLGDGRQIALDSVANGTVARQGAVALIKTADGRLQYKGNASEVFFNTLTNPRGSRVVSVTLSDGSRVWLNAASSIRYPTAFPGTDRRVELTGEAYIEVARDASRPFRVSNGGLAVEVLGTAFDANTYSDEPESRVTLIEGSVRVEQGGRALLLKPGEQAMGKESGSGGRELRLAGKVDPEAVLAWKNGFFHFERASLQTVLRELARWYDLDIRYEGVAPDRVFGGEIQRDLPLTGVLRLLQLGKIHYRIEGRTLTVLP